jgi:hypothetical protein
MLQLLMLEADLYQQINMLEVAIDKIQSAIQLEPNDPILHFALAYNRIASL